MGDRLALAVGRWLLVAALAALLPGFARAEALAADTIEGMNGKRGGVITGSFHDSVIAEALPESTVSGFNNYADMIAALKSDKIDFFLASVELARSMTQADGSIRALPEPVRVLDIGAMFAKSARGDALKTRMDAFIESIRADGTLDQIYAFWSDPANKAAAVDGGQREAALALGYSSRRAFFRIILPQAIPHILPAFRGQTVELVKATAVVGYIAVQDLTKMGDIVRSRTYEAFFPLIAVTVIYSKRH